MLREVRLKLWSLALATFTLAGCKCGGPAGELGGIFTSYCNYMDRCPDQVDFPIAYRNTGECVDILNFATTCRVERVAGPGGDKVPTLKMTTPTIDAAQAAACKSFIDSASCGTPLTGCDSSSDAGCNPCSRLFAGTGSSASVATGTQLIDQPCDDGSLKCVSGLYCLGAKGTDDGGTTCRVCKATRALGGDCVDPPHVPCGPGLFCDTTAGTCAGLLAAGAKCQSWGDCLSGFCNNQVCDPGGNEGSACDAGSSCRQGYCNSGGLCGTRSVNGGPCQVAGDCQQSNCDVASGKCGRPEGATCSFTSDCQGYCDSTTKQCKSGAANGQSCSQDDQCASHFCPFNSKQCATRCGSGCAAGQFCDSYGACTAPRADGASCRDNQECTSNFCNSHELCATRPAIGDSCTDYADCLPKGLCSGGKCVAYAKPGAACTSLDSCAPPFLCTKGTCQLINLTCEPGKVGQQCTWLQVCEAGAYCSPLDTFTCEPAKTAGASCLQNTECASGLYCNNRSCAPYATAGATCDRRTICAAGLFCDTSSSPGKCTAPRAVGETCSNDTDCVSGACDYRSGSGQVCVAACVPVPLGDQPACHPAKCTDLGATCGVIDGGCGEQVFCGQCTKAYETCGGGGQALTCGCTPTGTCDARQCNTSFSDGCGHQVQCNATCADGGSCGGGGSSGVCGCQSDRAAGPSLAAMATSFRTPQLDGGNFAPWDTLGAISTADDAGAHVAVPGATGLKNSSQYLLATGFGFNLPPTASVNGIEVRFRRMATGQISDSDIALFSGGKRVGISTSSGSSWDPAWTTVQVGGQSILWGHPFTPAEINSPDFGVGLQVSTFTSASANAYVDSVEMTIDYAYRCDCQYTCKSTSECGSDGCGGFCGALAAPDGGCAGDAGTCSGGYCQPLVFVDSARGLMWLNEQFDRGSCTGVSAGGYTDWRAPTIDELRTRIVGCAATSPGGACTVTTTCADAGPCLNAACDGCPGRQGQGQYGCFLDNHTEWIACTGGYQFFSSTKDGTTPYGVDFATGKVSLASGQTRYRCVRP